MRVLHIPVSAWVVLALWSPFHARSAEIPADVRAGLEQNAKDLGPIEVTWTYSGHSTLTAEQFSDKTKVDVPMAEYFLSTSVWQTVWHAGKYFCQIEETREGHRSFNEGSFDGQIIYMGTRYDDRATLSKYHPSVTKKDHGDDASFANARYFEIIGLPLPAKLRELAENKPPCTEILAFASSPKAAVVNVESIKVDGENVMRITLRVPDPDRAIAEKTDPEVVKRELERTIDSEEFKQRKLEAFEEKRRLPEFREYVYDLDPGMNYAMRKCVERYADGRVLRVRNCEGFEKLAGRNLWLPTRCEDSHYTFWSIPGVTFESPIIRWTYEVNSIKVDAIPDEKFELRYDGANVVVHDRSRPVEKD